MNIAFFTDTFIPEINGVATATNTLFKTFREHGHTCYVVCTNPYSDKLTYEDGVLRIPGIMLKKLYNYRMAGLFHPKATKIIRSWNLDVIHTQTEALVGIYGRMIASNFGIALISTYHTMLVDYTYYATHGIMDQTAKSIVKQFTKIISSACTEFTTPSEKTKDALRSYGVNRYINVIPNGIDLSQFDSSKVSKEKIDEFKKKYHLEDTYILLSLGRVAAEKSNDVILEGYNNYLKKNPKKKTVLVVVGDGPDKENLIHLSYELGIAENVIFIGAVPHSEVPFYYALADLYISASVTETQGLTYIESMASKTLVLCRYDENLEGVITDNKTGFFFSDDYTFTSRLEEIINMDEEKKKQIIENAFEANKKYSMDVFYERMLEVYNRAIRKKW